MRAGFNDAHSRMVRDGRHDTQNRRLNFSIEHDCKQHMMEKSQLGSYQVA